MQEHKKVNFLIKNKIQEVNIMYVKKNSVSEVNFLASSKYQNFTRMVSDEGITADEKGRKIVPAGTVYKNENGVAIGLLFHDVDVTNGPHEAAVMYQGIVIGARLPATVSEADKATMKGIMFKDEYENQGAQYKKYFIKFKGGNLL